MATKFSTGLTRPVKTNGIHHRLFVLLHQSPMTSTYLMTWGVRNFCVSAERRMRELAHMIDPAYGYIDHTPIKKDSRLFVWTLHLKGQPFFKTQQRSLFP
jgi:hypothetical protein